MKKDRNAFFSEAGYFNQTNIPTPNMNMVNTPFTTQSQTSFYAGPTANMNYNAQTNMNPNLNSMVNYDFSDIESRSSKIERQINRLDARVSKLENMSLYPTEEIDTTTNMYMV